MGAILDLIKTIITPALISLALYLLFSYVIIPFFRRYHQRYAQYLPLHTISAHTSSLRDRVADALMHVFLPSSWRSGARLVEGHQHNDHDGDSVLNEEEGENMVGMNMDPARREALERRRSTAGDAEVRLSRELEEGFMDDSDDEGHDERTTSQQQRR
ncbi:hypothetical protein VTN00DRAFT_8672 [Thermoascus crustaceus]|uniref:uncharacterized protein n=1 Tax=Thermoascus crustaceus TaxID=5088 RepID=UPI003743C7A5